MNTRPRHRSELANPAPARRRTRLAFSLIEILVVIALLSLIIIGLVAMFAQTQRAYKLGMMQVDVLEAGRATTDMMTREFSQMSPAYQYNLGRLNGANGTVNCDITLHNIAPLFQDLPGDPTHDRTNLLEDVFFLTQENQRWTGIGYRVLDPVTGLWPNGGIGTLYRYETNAYFHQPLGQLFSSYSNIRYTNMTRLLDGVVHFTVRAFDTNGVWINRAIGTNITLLWPGTVPEEPASTTFYSNAVPASVEIELGILEERALERAKSINNPAVRLAFLSTNTVGKVHLFRWRVPVRNVDPTAYQ